VQNVMAAAVQSALADPGDRAALTGSLSAPVFGSQSEPNIRATPYAWQSPEMLPRREWLYGHLLIRKFLSATVAPGGVGKSALVTAETLAQVSGKPLLGVPVQQKLRVWQWNLEDPQEETARRIQAAALHYQLSPDDIGDRLFVDSGRDQRLVVATATRNGAVIVRPVVDGLIAEIIRPQNGRRRCRAIASEPYPGDRQIRRGRSGLKCIAATITKLSASQMQRTERKTLMYTLPA
jgi:hypothetical protein